MNHPDEMKHVREALAHLDAVRELADFGPNRVWGLSTDSLDEARFALLARLGQLVIDQEAQAGFQEAKALADYAMGMKDGTGPLNLVERP